MCYSAQYVRKDKGSRPPRQEKKLISGIVQINRRGTGYVAWPMDERAAAKKEKEDIEIANEHLRGALNGDTVEVELAGLFPRPKGKVVKVSARAKENFVCILKGGFAVPDDVRFYKPITVPKGAYADGEKVLVHLDSFDGTEPKGTVLQHLGKAGEHRVEMNAIVLEHGFEVEFPAGAKREA